jgi:hypothetical protein
VKKAFLVSGLRTEEGGDGVLGLGQNEVELLWALAKHVGLFFASFFNKIFCHSNIFIARPANLLKYSCPLLKYLIHPKLPYYYNIRYLSSRQCFSKLLIFITSAT